MFVTAESAPAVRDIVTGMPALFVIRFPFESKSVTVIVDVLTPFAVILRGDAAIVDLFSDAGPATKFTVVVAVAFTPPTEKESVLVPVVIEDVSVAVYVPLPLSLTPEIVPRLRLMTTVSPPLVIRLPLASKSVTVTVDVLVPFAVIEVGEATMVDLAAEAAARMLNETLALVGYLGNGLLG